jgi:hypothetical protein
MWILAAVNRYQGFRHLWLVTKTSADDRSKERDIVYVGGKTDRALGICSASCLRKVVKMCRRSSSNLPCWWYTRVLCWQSASLIAIMIEESSYIDRLSLLTSRCGGQYHMGRHPGSHSCTTSYCEPKDTGSSNCLRSNVIMHRTKSLHLSRARCFLHS